MAKPSASKLTAADVMQADVVSVEMNETLKDALDTMTGNHLTGLPVMNSADKCVGMITATDILNYEQEHAEYAGEANSDMALHFDMDSQKWESVRITTFALEVFAEVKVSEVMARNLIAVSRETPLRDVAQKLVGERVHRVLVMGDRQELYGIISATDFVRLYAGE